MSIHMIELLIFAGIAFFIINRLIAALGSTSDEDPAKRNSYFGEPTTIRDVTSTETTSQAQEGFFKKKKSSPVEVQSLNGLIVEEKVTSVVNGLETLLSRFPSFNPVNFIRNAKTAFQMIIESAAKGEREQLVQLVDKRYLEDFDKISSHYGNFVDQFNLDAKFSEIYMFGNTAFIKLLLEGTDVTDTLMNFKEEWTFSKSLITKDLDWFLTNIEKS